MSVAGKLAYQFLYKPILGPLKDNGGLWGYITVKCGRRKMIKASQKLLIPTYKQLNSNVTIVVVAGAGNWYQAIFCLYSLYINMGFNMPTTVIDDGTISPVLAAEIKKQIPFVTIVSHTDGNKSAKNFFNQLDYPAIAAVFEKFVVYKKIFQARLLVAGTALILDADMLFYKKPQALIDWIDNPDRPVYMYDKHSIYGTKPQNLLRNLNIKPNVNTGIIGLNNSTFNFSEVEILTKAYLQADDINYLMEQGLYAMYLSNLNSYCLPSDDYEILPNLAEVKNPMAVMHHFPTENRRYYFRHAWKHILN